MKRKITLLTSIYVLSALFSISASAYDIEINGLQYDVVKKAKQASLVYCNKYAAPKDIEIPSTITFENVECDVTTIKFGSFLGCSDITSVKIPNSITSIEGKAFYNCKKLSSVKIPNSITSIGISAFGFCDELTDFYCYAENVPTTSTYAFRESYIEYATLHVPASAIDEYKKAEPWCNFGNIVAIEDTGIKSVKDRGIAIQSSAGIINIYGLESNEKVSFYGIDGRALGSATAINGTTSFSAQSGTVVIAKIGKESIKIAVE